MLHLHADSDRACCSARTYTPQVLAVLIMCMHHVHDMGTLNKETARDIYRVGLFAHVSASRCSMCFENGSRLRTTVFGKASACRSCFRRYSAVVGRRDRGTRSSWRELPKCAPDAIGQLATTLLDAGHSKLLSVLEYSPHQPQTSSDITRV
jgi:hypothetical protein